MLAQFVLLLLLLSASATKPNIVLVLTDDVDTVLGTDVAPLPKTRKWIKEAGVNLAHAFVNTPICCPSRASILTGTKT